MLNVNVEFDKKELKKLIEGMDLYLNTKEVVAQYKAVADKVDEREILLQQQLDDVKLKHLQNLLDQETANVAEIIYLKIQAKKMAEEMQIIDTLVAEAKQEKEELMINYYKVYRNALSKDSAIAKGYNVTPIVDSVLSQTMAIIAEVGAEAREQYLEMSPDIDELFGDAKVRQVFPRILDESFEFHRHNPSFSGSKTVLESHDIETAISGRVSDRFKAKDVE
ncbi:hypothetical protein MKY15_15675 [Sporosarcina sp. FSL K6-1540]|uniref:hypothetical protein n=1 Tax=Sporosarcina sp. FSL K6-1540 TaxID=2921555 RepID=UPI00315B2AFA